MHAPIPKCLKKNGGDNIIHADFKAILGPPSLCPERREKEATTESNLAECLQPEGVHAQRAYVPHLNCGKSLSQMTGHPQSSVHSPRKATPL